MNARNPLLLAAMIALASFDLEAQVPDTIVGCELSDGVARLVFENISDVMEIAVLRPDGGKVHVFSHRLGVYEAGYPSLGVVEIDPASLDGWQYAEDGKLHPRKAFDGSGVYEVRVIAVPAKAPPTKHYARFTCALYFAQEQGFLRGEVFNNEGVSTSVQPCENGDQPTIRSDCKASSGCEEGGNGYCCTSAGSGSPCYCDNCCVAR